MVPILHGKCLNQMRQLATGGKPVHLHCTVVRKQYRTTLPSSYSPNKMMHGWSEITLHSEMVNTL